jgi:hypothetical protein
MNKTKSNGKAVFDKGWAAFERLGGPVNKLSNKLGCEAFCPMPLDQECDKTARILRSFCGMFSSLISPKLAILAESI